MSQAQAATLPRRLPLPEPAGASAAAAAELGSIARSSSPQRLLVGARTHADMPALARLLNGLGAEVQPLDGVGVLAAQVPSGTAAAAALRGDGRVAYVERERVLQSAADRFDALDPDTGIGYLWHLDEVRAAQALFAAGGGSRREVAVIDTGIDASHPDLEGRIARTYDALARRGPVTDGVGHGTFVAGLVAAVDGNGVGIKGVAGRTRVVAIRASLGQELLVSNVVRGIQLAVRARADVINLSLGGDSFGRTQARALDLAFLSDVLPVAAAGNRGDEGNPLEFPAAALGGARGARGVGLSVAATLPGGGPAGFSAHNDYVSVAAPGAAPFCDTGVFSTIPLARASEWDRTSRCPARIFTEGGGRWAYGQGTSFSTPIASGIAALVWQVEPRLASEQVADVIGRSARQTLPGSRWNEYTGRGVVNGEGATALARTYDLRAPKAGGKARRRGRSSVSVSVRRARDLTTRGRELAGRARVGLMVSRDGGRNFSFAVRLRTRAIRGLVRLGGRRPNVLVAVACDANGNCSSRRLGRFRPPRYR